MTEINLMPGAKMTPRSRINSVERPPKIYLQMAFVYKAIQLMHLKNGVRILSGPL